MRTTDALRASGRWLMGGPRRRALYEGLNAWLPALLGNRVRTGAGVGLRFTGGDTVGYILGISEPAVQRALVHHLHPGAVFYDIGAHAGFLTLIGSRLVGPTGHVHAFEPIPENVDILGRNLAANGFTNATTHQLALSDVDGTAQMAAGTRHITAQLEATGDTTVTVARCDSLKLEPPSVVKIDVEGAESKVLAGMERTLRECRPAVIVEVHRGQREPVEALLGSFDYVVQLLADGGMPHLLAIPRERFSGATQAGTSTSATPPAFRA